MNRFGYHLGSLLAFFVSVSMAQTSLDPGVSHRKEPVKHHYAPKRAAKFKKPNVRHTAQYEFYKRVEMAAKEKQRILKKLAKPQFSDPTYFGHKRKPKRRAPHKMKYCHECSIRH